MGNTSTNGTSGWLFSDDRTLVLLRLNDSRSIGLSHGEEIEGLVTLGDSPAQKVGVLTRTAPSQFLVAADSVVLIEFQAVPAVNAGGGSPTGRGLGTVRLPLEHVQKRCGRSLYFMWFPLCLPAGPSGRARATSSMSDSSGMPQDGAYEPIHTLDHFDRALRNAARDPRRPMLCLSLCPADAPEAKIAVLDSDISPADKSTHFGSLLHSHGQHARLLQALYRINRNSQQSRQLEGTIGETRGRGMENSWFSPDVGSAAADEDSGYLADDINRLQNEITSTTQEANVRINQASDAIRTLRERQANRTTEHDRMKRDTQRRFHEAEQIDAENERLLLAMERGLGAGGVGTLMAGGAGTSSADAAAKQEVTKLQQDVRKLREEKEGLILKLEDAWKRKESPGGQAQAPETFDETVPMFEQPQSSDGMRAAPAPSVYEEQGWINLLPRPSELLLEDDD